MNEELRLKLALEEDLSKDPIIREIVMSNLIGMVTAELARRLSISPERAFDMFYESDTCRRLHDRSTGLYLYGHLYIADDFVREHQYSGV